MEIANKVMTRDFLFFQGGGEMGELMRNKDWSLTKLGEPDQWTEQLKQMVATMLSIPSPMLICWGPEFTQLYNDAFRPINGKNKHPQALGISAEVTYEEIWPTIKPLFEGVMKGKPVAFQDFKLWMQRSGYDEEVYFDFSYSPIKNAEGSIQGILVICWETTEKVKSHRRLVESERRFQNLIREATVGVIVVTGKEFRVDVVNNAYARLIGRDYDQLIGRNIFEVIPETQEAFKPIMERVRTTGTPEYLYSAPYTVFSEGREINGYSNLVYQPYREQDGSITGVMVLCQDVTEQVSTQKKIEASEKRFRSLVQNAPVATCLFVGRQMKIALANRQMLEYWRRDESVIGLPLVEAIPEFKGQAFLKILDQVYINGDTHTELEAPVQFLVNGTLTTYYFNYTYKPLLDDEGNVYAIVEMAVDVSEEVLAKRKIAERDKLLSNAIKLAELGTWEIDVRTGVVTLSENHATWLGLGINVPLEVFVNSVHEDYRADFKQALHELANTDSDEPFVAEYVVVNPTRNEKMFLHARGQKYYDAGHINTRFIGSVQDMTLHKSAQLALEKEVQKRTEELAGAVEELRATNEELAESNEKLTCSNEELAQFAYIASHDLQEPLRKITTFSGMLQNTTKDILDAKSKGYVDKIRNSATRMNTLIRDVLSYSELSRKSTQFEVVDLNGILDEVIVDFDLLIEQKSATISYKNLPTIEAVPLQMKQLFSNLIGNALKFTRTDIDSNITIQSERTLFDNISDETSGPGPGYFKITISDNGIGFDEEYVNQIFNIFQRLHRKSEFEGTGIGLAMCNKIALNHHGEINANGSSKAGAVFNVILPERQQKN